MEKIEMIKHEYQMYLDRCKESGSAPLGIEEWYMLYDNWSDYLLELILLEELILSPKNKN